MKKILAFILLVMSTYSQAQNVNTSDEVVDEIRIQLVNGDSFYYFLSKDRNWSSQSCPKAIYAFVKESEPGAKAIMSAALTSKASNLPITFTGECGDAGGNPLYIKVNYATF